MTDGKSHTDLTFKAEIELYYDLHLPANAHNAPLMIAVHGYGAHKRYMMREARAVAPDNYVIAAIQAPHPHYRKVDDGYRIGYGWLSDDRPEQHIRLHHKFVNDVIDTLTADGTVDPARVTLYGFSQACALNFRYAFTYPDRLAAVIGVCGGIPGDLAANEKYRPFAARTLYIYGDDDEFYTNEKFAENAATLTQMLPNFASKQFHAKHEITEEMREEMRVFLK